MVRYLKSTDLTSKEKKSNKKVEEQSRTLLYSGGCVSFKTEKDLELFFLDYLSEFLPDIQILDNQVTIENQRIDIIAVDNNNSPDSFKLSTMESGFQAPN